MGFLVSAIVLAVHDRCASRRAGWVIIAASGVASCLMRTLRMRHSRNNKEMRTFDGYTLYLDYTLAIVAYAVACCGMLGGYVQRNAIVSFLCMCFARIVWGRGYMGECSHTLAHVIIVWTLWTEAVRSTRWVNH